MSKSCGITGPLHSMVRHDITTEEGNKSVMQDVFPNNSTEVFYEVNDGTAKKPVMRSVKHKIQKLIKQFVVAHNNAKAIKEQADEAAQGIRVFAKEFREERFKNTGKYKGSYRINGEKTAATQYAVSCAAQDRFSLPKKEEDIDTIRKLVGKSFFNKYFERELNISIRKEIMEDKKQRRELTDKLIDAFGGEEELKKWFVKEEVWTVKPGLLEGQYDLDEETRQSFSDLCPQYSDQVKNASYDPKKA